MNPEMQEQLNQIIILLECLRRIGVALATNEKAREQDFDPTTIAAELAITSPQGI
jgi:hypothetical protein